MEWFRYFLGTPQRFVRTLVGLAIVAVLIDPTILSNTVSGLMAVVSPLIGPIVTIVIVWFAIKKILGIK